LTNLENGVTPAPSISLTSGLLYGTLTLAARSQEMATAPNIAHIIAKMA